MLNKPQHNYTGYITNSQEAIILVILNYRKVVNIMGDVRKVKIENGYFIFKLENLLSNKNISINKLMRDTNTDFKVIKRLMTGDITKIDTNVLARLCNYLECTITDIFEYTNNK